MRGESVPSRPSARWVGGILGACGLAALVLVECRESPGKPQNLVLLTLDTTRTDRLGTYGGPAGATPALDALAARGTTFEQAVAQVPLTRPSHATIVTGLLPHRHGVWSNGPYRLEDRFDTLAERFRSAGWQTAAVVGSFVLARSFGLEQGFDLFDDELPDVQGADPERPAGAVVDRALRWMAESRLAPPFALWLHFYDPHEPYAPPEPFRGRFAGDPYTAEVSAMDAAIGRLTAELARRGWLEETLIVAVGDHAEALGEHGEATHGYLVYESTLRVPLIMAGPGIPAGARVRGPVGLVDLMPTLVEAFGLARPGGVTDGGSLWKGITRSQVLPRPVLFEHRSVWNQFGWAPLTGLRSGSWKLIDAPVPELFDLEADPQETQNLAAAQPDRLERLRSEWQRRASRLESLEHRPQALSPEAEERLSALGYVAAGHADEPTGSGVDPKAVTAILPQIDELIAARRAGQREPQARLIEAILERDPTNRFALRCRGEELVRSRRYRDAVSVLESLVSFGGPHPETLATLASAYEGLGRIDEAVGWYEKAVTPPWIYWPALESLARLSAARPGSPLRSRHLARLRQLAPRTYRERLSVSRAFLILGMGTEAERSFRAAITEQPGAPEARVGLAQALLAQRRAAEAEEVLREIRPPTVESGFVRGLVFEALGRPTEACRQHEVTLSAEPTNVNLLAGLGRRLERCGRADLARMAYRRALAASPGRDDLRAALSRVE
jgi:choline-sulfatase